MTLDTIIDLGQTVAVFASLVFVDFQIRQHTRALKATSHHAITDSFNAINALLVSDQNIARIWRSGLAGLDNLDEDEAMSFSYMALAYMRIFETLYYQYKTGTMEEKLFEAELRTLKWSVTNPGVRPGGSPTRSRSAPNSGNSSRVSFVTRRSRPLESPLPNSMRHSLIPM